MCVSHWYRTLLKLMSISEGLRATETVEIGVERIYAADRKKKESCCYFSLRGEPWNVHCSLHCVIFDSQGSIAKVVNLSALKLT